MFKNQLLLSLKNKLCHFNILKLGFASAIAFLLCLNTLANSAEFDPLPAIDKTSGLLEQDIARLQALYSNDPLLPEIVRIVIWNTSASDPYKNKEIKALLERYYTTSAVVFVPENLAPLNPFIVPGESVVFHTLQKQRNIILGKYNPGLVNGYIADFLSQKYAEAKFWEKYSPGSMPQTERLSDVITPEMSIKDIQVELQNRFPGGWVMKGVWDSATQKDFLISDKLDLHKEVETYSTSHFSQFRDKQLKKANGENPDVITRLLRDHPGYRGWRIKRALKNPTQAIVQARIHILKEYRVEVIGGKVLGDGSGRRAQELQMQEFEKSSTIERYDYTFSKPPPLIPAEIITVEKAVQEFVDKLPIELRGMPMGVDAAIVLEKNGTHTVQMIESNPQGNSGFLATDKRGVRALNKYLERYPTLVAEKIAPLGLDGPRQMKFIRAFMREFHIDPARDYTPYEFQRDQLFEKRTLDSLQLAKPGSCRAIFG